MATGDGERAGGEYMEVAVKNDPEASEKEGAAAEGHNLEVCAVSVSRFHVRGAPDYCCLSLNIPSRP